ncbi:MAG: ferritin [Rhodothermales bacterium]|nr:ferritin [Rhodothermales bacterium]
MKKSVVDAINSQIHAEFESAYTYLAMSARMEALNLPGFAAWLRIQWEEEIVHAMKFVDFMIQRDFTVELQALSQPKAAFKTPLQAFEEVLEHEQYITGRIHELYSLAVKESDYPLQTLLQWFIDEQVEEEENARAAIDSLRLVGDSGPGLFMLDREMGARRQPTEEDGR